MKTIIYCLLCFFILFCIPSCYRMRASKGGGQIKSIPSRKITASDIAMPKGYRVEALASGLTFPTACDFDDQGNLYVVEAGYSYGEVWTQPKLLRMDAGGKSTVVATGSRNGPWTGVSWYNDAFYVAEGGEMEGGKILRITREGAVEALISNLPSVGDHHTNGPAIKDGYIYFGQGTATNSAIVGPDNKDFGWLLRRKDFADIPCKDIILTGQNYASSNLLDSSSKSQVMTGAFSAFGTSTNPGQVIKGQLPCTGAILRIPITGGPAELVAWGLRNPFGLSFSPDGNLFATENGFDDRGSRPVWGAGDVLWQIQPGTWYGWPDFSAGIPVVNESEFAPPGKGKVKALIKQHPNTPPKPSAVFGVHASANGIDFSKSAAFGYQSEAFVAEFGDMSPNVGKVEFPVGFKIVRVNPNRGVIRDFAVNRGKRNGPASWLKKGGLERPVSVKFNREGNALYIVDFGILRMTKQGPEPQAGTGTIWKITKE